MSRSYHIKNYSLFSADEKIRQYLEVLLDHYGIGLAVNEQECELLIKQLLKLRKNLEATSRRGGTTLVLGEGGAIITAYHAGCYDNRIIRNPASLVTLSQTRSETTYS